MKKGERTKLELLRIAYNMFLVKGYENTSIDEIIKEAKIAKGTYYYHFDSKEKMLEEVIQMMLDTYTERANDILKSNIPLAEKTIKLISAFKPNVDELPIVDTLNRQDNLIMHNKINRQLIEIIVPMLSELASEGVKHGVLNCGDIPERIKILTITSGQLFDNMDFSSKDIDVFLDIVEKTLGAKVGSMSFLRKLISV